MIEEGVLDTDVFSILWPQSQSDLENIMFSGYDENFLHSELVGHSLFLKNATQWRIGVDSLYLKRRGGSSVTQFVVKDSKPNRTAHFMSRSPYIALLCIMAETFHSEIN